MKINRYNGFIFESVLHGLINESKFIYTKDFDSVLTNLLSNSDKSISKIARFVKKMYNTDIDNLLQNYISLNNDPSKITFYPDNKVKTDNVSIINNILSMDSILDKMNIQDDIIKPYDLIYNGSSELDEGTYYYGRDRIVVTLKNNWKILKEYDDDYGYDNIRFFLLQNVIETSYYVVVFIDTRYANNSFIPIYDTSNIKSSSVKIGRFVNKLLDLYFIKNETISLNIHETVYRREDFTPADIEKFVNVYSSEVLFLNSIDDFIKIVDGEDIKYWYNVDQYENNNGQLGNSCMRYKYCQSYFDIYTKNPDVCKLLILVNTNNKLIGRALLWTDITGKKWIDRIYTNKDNYISVFDKWSKKNNYESVFYNDDADIKVQIKKEDYSRYPYMDSLSVYSKDDGILYSNRDNKELTSYCVLQETNGSARYY